MNRSRKKFPKISWPQFLSTFNMSTPILIFVQTEICSEYWSLQLWIQTLFRGRVRLPVFQIATTKVKEIGYNQLGNIAVFCLISDLFVKTILTVWHELLATHRLNDKSQWHSLHFSDSQCSHWRHRVSRFRLEPFLQQNPVVHEWPGTRVKWADGGIERE